MAITVGGTNITLNSGSVLQDPPGTAPSYLCRAWVNFNGTGTVAIRASGNVSSITDNGTGDYTVNFTTAMSDANYGFALSTSEAQAINKATNWGAAGTNQTTTAIRVYCRTGGNAAIDADYFGVAIFR